MLTRASPRLSGLEYFAGHFQTPNGEWSRLAKNATACAPLDREPASQWPARVAADAWARATGTAVWRVAESSLARHDDHPGSLGLERDLWIGGLPVAIMFDCRHFCFPGATLEARNYALLDLEQFGGGGPLLAVNGAGRAASHRPR